MWTGMPTEVRASRDDWSAVPTEVIRWKGTGAEEPAKR